ncbi:ABC transporter substrate-binding protein [Nitratireductor sp. CH_MIT9313-5]|uniref:ABC transporter substrate-binding protein n=1 Tax=Nitratireductor sp. CH_MIT9313-5 TaxID=3107764 RepID=UPI00300BA88E
MKRLAPLIAMALAASISEARQFDLPPADGGQVVEELVIESTTDLAVFRPMVEAFQLRNPGLAVTYHELTSNEIAARQEEACMSGEFLADVVISSAVDQQLKLVNDGCAKPLLLAEAERLPDWARWRNELFGFTFEPAVMVYNRAWFREQGAPQSRFELIDLLRSSTYYTGRIGTYDIASSGLGYFFAFQDALQAGTWGRVVESLGRNNAKLYCCTFEILERVADGRLLIGYNVLGSYALDYIEEDDRIGIVLPRDYTLVMARAAFVPRQARSPLAASRFIDFMLSSQGRDILSNDMRLLSPIDGAERLERLTGQKADDLETFRPISMTPALLVGLDEAKREIFMRQWRAALPGPTSRR